MKSRNFVPIVDLFAGPGGLGEGFSSLGDSAFRIHVSAEMDPYAHQTLQLRAFYRALERSGGRALDGYYAYCNGFGDIPDNRFTREAWRTAKCEALQLTLGNPDHNHILDSVILSAGLNEDTPWVLIGGPPCQAYSLVGRSRNRGKTDYRPEDDHRHFLYREYLRIIREYRPAVFVMENVKGILSSSVGGEYIFPSILRDLADPNEATGKGRSRTGYRIHSLSHDVCFERGMNPADIDARKFIVRAEEYGVPQARHRVILLGVREDLEATLARPLDRSSGKLATVEDALSGLPRMRSTLSKQKDSGEAWADLVQGHFKELGRAAETRKWSELASLLKQHAVSIDPSLSPGALRFATGRHVKMSDSALLRWYEDPRLEVWLNHESRGHMSADLMRYAYASTFAAVEGRSPKGHVEFDLLDKLRPLHANWETGKFSDRFRVQLRGLPSTTITSHISKDGHYFIHPDPAQCRSLTVREAARLQTFPDNYFFQGNRTQQYHQVGNAVPPLLARQIAEAVVRIFRDSSKSRMSSKIVHRAA